MTAPPAAWGLQQSQASPVLASSPVPQHRLASNRAAPRFLRPDELFNDALFGFITPDLRREVNDAVTQDWHSIDNSLSANEKAASVHRLGRMSRMVFSRQQEWFLVKQQQQQQPPQQQPHQPHQRFTAQP